MADVNMCGKCGLPHGKLGVKIQGGTLFRSRADPSRHLLRAGGGSWAFEAPLIKKHDEVNYLMVTTIQGDTYQTHRSTFDQHAFPFSGAGREQLALSLKHWRSDGDLGQQENAPDGPTGVQPLLIESTETEGTKYEKAKKPRPRTEPKRRRWMPWG